jgi:MOSC domain-containing protein YiiM
MTIAIDSSSVGNEATFLPLDVLCDRLAAARAAPRDRGRVTLLVTRVADGGRREQPARVVLTAAAGMPGDGWLRKSPDKPEAQLTVMQHDVASLIANGQPLPLFGDNLFLDLDLSATNLPIGSRLRAGAVLLEVTPKAHNGCHKFKGRFGSDALRFVAHPDRRSLNLRGIYLRVVEDGEVAVGDAVEVVMRPPARLTSSRLP